MYKNYSNIRRVSTQSTDRSFYTKKYSLIPSSFLSYLLPALFFLLPACNSGGQTQNLGAAIDQNRLPNRQELRDVFRQKQTFTMVYPSDEKYAAFYQSKINKLNQNTRFGLTVKGIKSVDFKPEQLKNEVLFIVGNIASNPLLEAFQNKLPVSLDKTSFDFDGKTYQEENAIFKLYPYPNPYNSSLPLYLITGNSDEGIYQFLKNNYPDDWSRAIWSSWGYEIYEGGNRKLAGYLSEDTWELDKKIHFDFANQTDTIFQSAHFRFITHNAPIDKTTVETIAEQCESTYISLLDFIEQKDNLPKINYHFYPSVENKGLQRESMVEASANHQDYCIEVVMNENFQGSSLHQENKLVLRKSLGEPQLVALEEGLSNHFTKQWQKKGYEYWCQKLYVSDNLPPLKELLDNEFYEKESYLVMGAMSGVFTDFLIHQFGQKEFVKHYKNWTTTDLLALEGGWQAYLKTTLGTIAPPIPNKNNATIPYLKGFNFAHEGYRVFNGYGSQLAKESLQQIEYIGSNAVAIVPYSFMRNPKQPEYIPIIQGTGGENDQAVLFSHYEAQKMGMHSMLKPQIWVGRSWPGDIEMQNEKDWQQFFENYYRWARHYGLLAEINGFDSYCIGVEFAKATLAKEKEWRQLIRKIKGIYSGPMTYAANWGEEFENLKFWDELDFIGLNCYYPLSKNDNPSKRQLSNEFNKVLNKVAAICKKENKQLVFTEIGFRSVDGTWKNPHAEAGERAINEATQELCYEVVLEAIQNKKWCNGILWWKWPSHLGHYENEGKGFTPSNKKAENVIIKYFKTKNN